MWNSVDTGRKGLGMAFLAHRISRGKKYWSIVESRRVNGKPKHVILEYLGTADTLLDRLMDDDKRSISSYSHGDTIALLNQAKEMDIVNIVNRHVPAGPTEKKPMRDGLTVGASFLLAAIGRACRPTSKMGWYDWCKTTSLEYCLKSSFKTLDSQHFWDQMNVLPEETIPGIEEEIVSRLLKTYDIPLDTLLYDTSNFFTFIDSSNKHCDIPERGKNKQKRYDLRQIGLALLVSRKHQLPLFHKTYEGNKNDYTVFSETLNELSSRIKTITTELKDVTLVFDKGNNSKDNFKKLASQKLFYVAGLVPSHFKKLITEANKHFEPISINGEDIPAWRVKREIWGEERTCVILISKRLKEGQIRGIHQHLEKKYKCLEELKKQLENPKRKKQLDAEDIQERLTKIIKGQFIDEILNYTLFALDDGGISFTYYIDHEAFENLKKNVLGRKILVTNRHEWTSEEVILAYRGQAKVEYAFRTIKNPYHLAIRPQYHWTDQKIKVHFLICIIGYLLTMLAYMKAKEKTGYQKSVNSFMEDLKNIRLACQVKKKSRKVKYQLETIPKELKKVARYWGSPMKIFGFR
jgi:transposase